MRRGRGADDLVASRFFRRASFGIHAFSSTRARASAARRTFVASASAYPSTR
jgi:hypothetical protein